MSDSVGRISLEIDLSGSLDRQINTMATNIGSQLSGTIERHVRGSLGGVNRMLSSVRMPSMPTRTIQPPQVRAPEVDTEATRAQIASLGATLDNVNGKLDFQRRKLEELRGSFASTYNETRRNRLEGQILNTEAAILRLTQTSDRTASRIWELEDSLSDTAETATEASVVTDQLNNSLDRSNRSLNRSNNSLNRTGESARRTGHAFAFMGRQSNIMGNSVSRVLTRILKQVFVFAVLYQAIRGYTSHVGSAMRTNEAFMHSLNQVRTNLQVAFMPVYQAILPALNALMSALATVTAYIASFLSVLFGKTYKQSFKAAQGLNAAKTAMQGFGSASKKAAKDAKNATLGLAGFDEINSLAFTEEDEDVGGGLDAARGGGIAPLVLPDLDTSIIDGKMASLIGSIQMVLQPSIDALKRLWIAMDPFKSFVAKGAVDFFKNFLSPVGKWVMGEGVPRFLDALALGFQAVNWPRINEGLSSLWKVLTPFSLIVGEGLLWFWENVLVKFGAWTMNIVVPLFLDILSKAITMVNNTIEALKPTAIWLWEGFLGPLAKWTGGIIVSVLEKLAEWLGNIGDWIKDNQKWVESITLVLAGFAIAWGLVSAAVAIWAPIAAAGGLATWAMTAATTAFGVAVGFITSPITIAIAVIGALIAVGLLLWKNWDEVSAFLKDTWTAIKVAAKMLFEATKIIIVDVFTAIREYITLIWEAIKTYFHETWTGLNEAAEAIFEAIKTLIYDKFTSVSNSIKTIWTIIKTFIDVTWKALKTVADLVFNAIKKTIETVFTSVRTSISNVWTTIRSGLSNTWNGIRDTAKTVFEVIQKTILGAFEGVKNKMSGIWSNIWSTITSYINRIIESINGLISSMNKISLDVPDWVPGIGGKSFGVNVPSIPKLARGGIVDQPTLAMVGEAGKEAVMPLENNTGWINNLAGQIAGQMGGSGDDNQGVIEVLLMILAAIQNQRQDGPEPEWKLDGTTFARLIGPYLQAELQRMGSSMIQPI